MRLAVSLGGDADTQASIAAAVADAFAPIPKEHADAAGARLPAFLKERLEPFVGEWGA